MLSLLGQGAEILTRTIDPIIGRTNQVLTTILPEQTNLTTEKPSDSALGTFAKVTQLGQNLMSVAMQSATGISGMIRQDEPLEELMLRKKLEERNRYEKLSNQVIQKFVQLKNALDHHKQDHGQFYVDGNVNHAFIAYPYDTYSFKYNAISTDKDYITVFFNKAKSKLDLFECNKHKLADTPNPSGYQIKWWCTPAEYGKRTTGRLSALERLSNELDLVKTTIYATDIPGANIVNALQPDRGSFVENLNEKATDFFNPFKNNTLPDQ